MVRCNCKTLGSKIKVVANDVEIVLDPDSIRYIEEYMKANPNIESVEEAIKQAIKNQWRRRI